MPKSRHKHPRKKQSSRIHVPALVGWILLCELAGIVGSLFTISAIPTWFATLTKPVFSPPNWIFGPVWTLLYLLMGVSAYRVWRLGVRKSSVRNAMILFGIQLFLNAIWSIIFFGWHNIPFAFIDIAALWLTIIYLILRFHKLDEPSAYLMMPYLVWVSFATVLNYNFWLLNP